MTTGTTDDRQSDAEDCVRHIVRQEMHEYWLEERRVALERVDVLERMLGTEPRTSEIRKWWRER